MSAHLTAAVLHQSAGLDVPVPPAARPALPTSAMANADSPPPARLRILVADDNHDAACTLAQLLQAYGHSVQLCFDGVRALAEFERLKPQVCLLDIGMPGRDGYSVARAIRRLHTPQPLLMAVTGWGQAHDRQRALDAGFNHHLTKPVDLKQLLQLLQSMSDASPASGTRLAEPQVGTLAAR